MRWDHFSGNKRKQRKLDIYEPMRRGLSKEIEEAWASDVQSSFKEKPKAKTVIELQQGKDN